ncbi:MAG: MBL fold metallo-hydrolase, partial [Desulfosarcina sp.]|nr:MBL fold metallo-hydrolase [Desulfobacterales bacterium]
MIINKTGKIVDSLFMLGHSGVPVYLIDGDEPALFDAGFSCLGELYVQEIRKILETRKPKFCFLSHSHFDHCGAVSTFKKYFPNIKIVAAPIAKKNFKRPNAIALIKQLNKDSESMMQDIMITKGQANDFCSFDVDLTVQENDVLKIADNISVKIIETPGHTRDCLSYY